jgi:hypothetical protein
MEELSRKLRALDYFTLGFGSMVGVSRKGGACRMALTGSYP